MVQSRCQFLFRQLGRKQADDSHEIPDGCFPGAGFEDGLVLRIGQRDRQGAGIQQELFDDSGLVGVDGNLCLQPGDDGGSFYQGNPVNAA